MQRSRRVLSGMVLMAAGYMAGACFHSGPRPLHAQDLSPEGYERQTITDLQLLHQKLSEVATQLEGETRYRSAVDGTNAFAVAVGGVDAIKDLEENRGVDPETFGALYAGRANPEVFPHIAIDASGRLTYKGNIVRIYSRERLKKLYSRRDQLLRAR